MPSDGTVVPFELGAGGLIFPVMTDRARRLNALLAERDALREAWQSNHADRIKIQHRLDDLTHLLAELTGLEPLLGGVPQMFAGLGRRRSRRIS